MNFWLQIIILTLTCLSVIVFAAWKKESPTKWLWIGVVVIILLLGVIKAVNQREITKGKEQIDNAFSKLTNPNGVYLNTYNDFRVVQKDSEHKEIIDYKKEKELILAEIYSKYKMGNLPLNAESINYGLRTISNWKNSPEKYSLISVHIIISQIGQMLGKKYSFNDIEKIEIDLLNDTKLE